MRLTLKLLKFTLNLLRLTLKFETFKSNFEPFHVQVNFETFYVGIILLKLTLKL